MSTRRPLVLASASPRRRELLAQLTPEFVVSPGDVDERLDPARLQESLAALALDKAQAAAAAVPDAIVLAADTVVVIDGEVLGKPADANDARGMLRRLSGREHRVLTGVAVLDTRTGRAETRVVESRVVMRPFDAGAVDRYVASGEPLDKAGAYAIQGLGGVLVEAVAGSYSNVVGLPLDETRALLEAFGVPVRRDASSGASA
ncbi:MAG: septum formation inhibitor Maf [Candidatus Rokubacteria bacterium]|nr:septum formation inhibitor Maf [Candidatus Rokubacteria bacterium]